MGFDNWLRLAGMALSVLIATPAAVLAKDVILAPHRAVYDMALGDVRSGAGVSALSGRMVFEITGSKCNGYSQVWRYVTRSTDGNGEVTVNDQRSTSWEDGEAKRLRFESTSYRNRKLVNRVVGRADRAASGNNLSVTLTHPQKKTHALSATAMFPVQHSIAMIDAGRQGKRLFATDFYDGSENGDKIYHVSTLVGKVARPGYNAGLSRIANAARLDKLESWPVAVSYFEPGNANKDQVPSYEVAFVFFSNGVSRRLILDHGTFTIKGTLQKIDFLEPEPCRSDKRR